MALTVLRRDGYDDVYREIDEIGPAMPEYIVTSDHERETYLTHEQVASLAASAGSMACWWRCWRTRVSGGAD